MWNINWHHQHQIKEKRCNTNTGINTAKLYGERNTALNFKGASTKSSRSARESTYLLLLLQWKRRKRWGSARRSLKDALRISKGNKALGNATQHKNYWHTDNYHYLSIAQEHLQSLTTSIWHDMSVELSQGAWASRQKTVLNQHAARATLQ